VSAGSPRRRTLRALAPVFVIGVAALGLSACSSSSHEAAPSTTTTAPASTTTTTSPPASTTTTSPVASTTTTSPAASTTTTTLVPVNGNVTQCSTSNLALSIGSSSGSAGAVDVALVFSNIGSLPCYLYGYPGVSAVASPGGPQIGLAAQQATQLGPPAVVTLQPEEKANADLHVTDAYNYPSATCRPVKPAGFRVYPPGDTVPAFVASNLEVCSAAVAGQLSVGPVAKGASSVVNGGTSGSS
jgi:hypothetical protein